MEEQEKAWWWLSTEEKQDLQNYSPDAEPLVNANVAVADITEERFFAFTSRGYPHLPEKHVILSDKASGYVTVQHPLDPEFTKKEKARGLNVRVKLNRGYPRFVKAVMDEELRALPWYIYECEYAGRTNHIYLRVEGPGVSSDDNIPLYVPTRYFKDKDYTIVEEFHEKVAVGYYKGTGFGSAQSETPKWQEITRSALTKPTARRMREIVEGIIC